MPILNVFVRRLADVDNWFIQRERFASIQQYFPPGFTVTFKENPAPINSPTPNYPLELSQLRVAYLKVRQLDPPVSGTWNAWILIANELSGSSHVYGATFDADDEESNGLQREFCTLFATRIGKDDDKFRHTVVHELGHVLNLGHSEGGVMSEGLKKIDASLSPGAIAHLTTHPAPYVMPGGLPFGSDCGAVDQSYRHAGIDVSPQSGILALKGLPLSSHRIMKRGPLRVTQGEPVIIRSKLTNPTRNLRVSLPVGMTTDPLIRFELMRPDGSWINIRSPALTCSGQPFRLSPGGCATQDHVIVASNREGLFVTPGPYQIRASIVIRGREHRSRAILIDVRECHQSQHREMCKRYCRPTDRLAISAFGSCGDAPDVQALRRVSSKFPRSHGLTKWYRLEKGGLYARRFLSHHQAKDYRLAQGCLTPFLRSRGAPDVFHRQALLWMAMISAASGYHTKAKELCIKGLRCSRHHHHIRKQFAGILGESYNKGG